MLQFTKRLIVPPPSLTALGSGEASVFSPRLSILSSWKIQCHLFLSALTCSAVRVNLHLSSMNVLVYPLANTMDRPPATPTRIRRTTQPIFCTHKTRRYNKMLGFKKLFTGELLIYNVMLVSGMRQSESVIRISTCHCRVLSRVPCVVQ